MRKIDPAKAVEVTHTEGLDTGLPRLGQFTRLRVTIKESTELKVCHSKMAYWDRSTTNKFQIYIAFTKNLDLCILLLGHASWMTKVISANRIIVNNDARRPQLFSTDCFGLRHNRLIYYGSSGLSHWFNTSPPRPPPTGALLPDSNSILHFKAENTETPPNQLWSLNLSLRRKRQKNALPT